MSKHSSPFDHFPNLGQLANSDTEYEVPAELVETRDILDEPPKRPSFAYHYLISGLIAAALIIRLLNLQITHGYENRSSAEGNRIRLREVEPPRGIITDRQGQALVRNIPSYNLEINPADLPKQLPKRQEIYQTISRETGIALTDITKIEKSGLASIEPFIVKENLDRDTALTWESRLSAVPGVVIAKYPRREYSPIPAISHLLGYVSKISAKDLPRSGYTLTSRIGRTGLESFYETDLRGSSGREQIEVNAQGQLQRIISTTAPNPGYNLILSLDNRLQTQAAAALQESMQANHSDQGVALALDPRTGGILASVSLPAYDNNLFARGITNQEYQSLMQDKNRPIINRAISGTYPSGSVIKPVVATAALQEKVINEHTTLDTSPGAIHIGQWVFPDWKVHGLADVRQAIAESNDIFFYALGGGWNSIGGLGIDRLSGWLRQFNFGSPLGIDLPGEVSGLVPDDAWKRKTQKEPWYIGDTYHLSIGQGYFLTTPLQIANSISTIANGGELLKPHLVDKIIDNQGTVIRQVGKEVIKSNFINPNNLQVVREGMRLAVTNGSARLLNDLPVSTAAKTGTAQFGTEEKTHGWFVTFAPYDNPEIVVIVLVEGGGEGYSSAGPVAKKILQSYFNP